MPTADSPLKPHIQFKFQKRLREEFALRNSFPAEPLPEELLPPPAPGYADAATQTTGPKWVFSESQHARQKARIAVEREHRFHSVQATALGWCLEVLLQAPHRRAEIHVAVGCAFDAGLIAHEDREYKLDELVGSESCFHMRLVPWGGTQVQIPIKLIIANAFFSSCPRVIVAAEKSLVLVVNGRPCNRKWYPELAQEATRECDTALASVVQSPEDIAAGKVATLSGVNATEQECMARKEHRCQMHESALEQFPIEGEQPKDYVFAMYVPVRPYPADAPPLKPDQYA
ncbi:hypothetical protein DFH09DRAFT_1074916 [Mycena vulgaris]|nr:hypothetical protein DFH09DRAFT_1074916 [Mycena vulgaris]